jgi:phosphoribosylanthranilate isomerase
MTKIKICGLMDKHTVDEVCRLGADYLGFVFAKSKREVISNQVRLMTTDVPLTIQKVGVFVSPTIEQLQRTVQEAGLDLVQIHGDFPNGSCGVPMIQAKSVNGNEKEFKTTADFLLLDAPPKEFYGGNGEPFSWEAVQLNLLPQEKLFIAGGLTAENVQQAITYFQPFGVDVSSGVETNGVKDLAKIQAFINQVREYDHVSTTR